MAISSASPHRRRLLGLAAITTALTLVLVVVGAYVRLHRAGLGCPDWPGCYGQLTAPDAPHEIAAANQAFPARPADTAKGQKEMFHRYIAGTLGFLILGLTVAAIRDRERPGRWKLPAATLLVAFFQAALGRWTVTLLVHPAVVTAHLLGGMLTLGLLAAYTFGEAGLYDGSGLPSLRWPAVLGLAALTLQIALGGWTSANYAGIACNSFPACYGGVWVPPADFAQAFHVFRPTGVDYEGGLLDQAARTAVQLTHRLGAVIAVLVLGGVAAAVAARARGRLRWAGLLVLGALAVQFTLGAWSVVWVLPMPLALAHNAGAALLVVAAVNLVGQIFGGRRDLISGR